MTTSPAAPLTPESTTSTTAVQPEKSALTDLTSLMAALEAGGVTRNGASRAARKSKSAIADLASRMAALEASGVARNSAGRAATRKSALTSTAHPLGIRKPSGFRARRRNVGLLANQQAFPVATPGPEAGRFYISTVDALQCLGMTSLAPGTTIRVLLSTCRHKINLIWPHRSGNLGHHLKFRYKTCSKCAAEPAPTPNVTSNVDGHLP